jgi:Mce-associated membrane protein
MTDDVVMSHRHRMPRRGRRPVATRLAVALLVIVSVVGVAAGGAAGYFYGAAVNDRAVTSGAQEAERLARDATVAMLAYTPDNVDTTMRQAADRLTGDLKARYEKLANDVVIPTAKDKRVLSLASVVGSALVSTTAQECVVLVFVNQSTAYGDQTPTDAASAVKVTLRKVDGRWMISGFDPV